MAKARQQVQPIEDERVEGHLLLGSRLMNEEPSSPFGTFSHLQGQTGEG
jgi:hypothetical protein